MGGKVQKSSSRHANINVTPYIDILLVLLIIFMSIQPTMEYELKARTADKAEQSEQNRNVPIVLSVDSAFKLEINGEAIPYSTLGERIFDIFRARPDKRMFVRGAADLPFGSVARIVDISKGAGVGDVGLLVK